MKIALTLLCRNEGDIIGRNLEFHLRRGVDFIIVTDNASDDDTASIVARFARHGRVELIREQRLTHDQSVWVSEMARRAARQQADWVINSDADEFWWSADDLRTTLANVPAAVPALSVRRHNFPPVRGGPADFAERMIYRDNPSRNAFGAPLPEKVIHRGVANVIVADGNHAVSFAQRPVRAQPSQAIEILHFPMRTFEQFRTKIVLGAEALERNGRIAPDVGAHWRHVYRRYYKHGLLPDYFGQNELTPPAIERRQRDGTLVIDTRLCDFLALSGATT